MTATSHIYIFVNPFSKKAAVYSRWIEKELISREVKYSTFISPWPETAGGCTEAWIVGGDGTLNYFLNKYDRPQFPLAIFKAGTGNDLYHHLYGNANREEHLQRVMGAEPKPVDAASCNNIIYVSQAGFGFDGEVLKSMKTIRRLGNFLGYYLTIVRNIFLYREPEMKITAEGESIEGKLLLTYISNSSQTGGGFKVNPAADLGDGLLDLLICRRLGLWQRLKYLPIIRKGKHLDLPFIEHRLVKSVKLECQLEIAGQLDGELVRGHRFDCAILPGYMLMKF